MIIYLASPYINNPEENFKQTEAFTAECLKKGVCMFSPIVHCHEIAQKFDLPKTFDFWQKYNFGMLAGADVLWVLKLPGWESSKGVTEEIKFALEHDKPVVYVDFNPESYINEKYKKCWAFNEPAEDLCSGEMNITEQYPGEYIEFCTEHDPLESKAISIEPKIKAKAKLKEMFLQAEQPGIPCHWVVQYYHEDRTVPEAAYFNEHQEALDFIEKNGMAEEPTNV